MPTRTGKERVATSASANGRRRIVTRRTVPVWRSASTIVYRFDIKYVSAWISAETQAMRFGKAPYELQTERPEHFNIGYRRNGTGSSVESEDEANVMTSLRLFGECSVSRIHQRDASVQVFAFLIDESPEVESGDRTKQRPPPFP